MDRSDRIAKRIVARSKEVQEAIYELWMDKFSSFISDVRLPKQIHDSGWCMHHLGSKEHIKTNFESLTAEFVRKVQDIEDGKIGIDHFKKNDPNFFKKNSKCDNRKLKEKASNFLSELATIMYIPVQYHSYFDRIKKTKVLNIRSAYDLLEQINFLENDRIRNFSTVSSCLKALKSISGFIDGELDDFIRYELKTMYDYCFYEIFLK